MSTIKKLMMTAAGGEEPLLIEDVFSTYLYTGSGSTQTINNGINLNTTDTTIGYTSLLQNFYSNTIYKEYNLGKIIEDSLGNYYVIVTFRNTESGQDQNTITKYSASNQQLWSRTVSDATNPRYADIDHVVLNADENPVVFWTPAYVNDQLYVNVLDKDTGAVLATSNNSNTSTATANVLVSGGNLYWAGRSSGNTVYINSGTSPGTEIQAYRVSVGSSTSTNGQKLMLIPQSDGQPVLVSNISDQNSGTSTNGFVFTKLASNLQSEVWSTRWSHSNGSSTQFNSRYMSPGEHYYDPVDNMLYVIWTGINSISGNTTYFNYVSKFNIATGAHVISKRYYFNSASTANISARSITKFGNKIICTGKGYTPTGYQSVILEFDTNLTSLNVVTVPINSINDDLQIYAGTNSVYYHTAKYYNNSEIRKFPEFSITEAVLGVTPVTGTVTVTSASLTNTTTGYVPIYVEFGSPNDLMGASGSSLSLNSATLTYSTSTVPAVAEPGQGGMVWIKWRSGSATAGANTDNIVVDTERGTSVYLETNSTSPNKSATALSAFNFNGFTTGGALTDVDNSGDKFASWTFRKAPRFFDVVTYTGDGASSRTISHSLNCDPGTVIIKRTNSTSSWAVWHRSLTQSGGTGGGAYNLSLETTNAQFSTSYINSASSGDFTVGGGVGFFNTNGATYVAYLFAHDPLGPSGSDGMIACGSYTGNGSSTTTNGPSVYVGFEPQWILIKNASAAGDWVIVDSMRGLPGYQASSAAASLRYAKVLEASNTTQETGRIVEVNPTGFRAGGTFSNVNASGNTYIYMAIRRGPMRQPTDGSTVFAMDTYGSTTPKPPALKSGFPVDFGFWQDRNNGGDWQVDSRLAQDWRMTFTSGTQTSSSASKFDYSNGYINDTYVDSTIQGWMFRRAPGFFDVLTWTGNSTAGRVLSHNLGVAPEMIWIKRRNSSANWYVTADGLTGGIGSGNYILLNSTAAQTFASPTLVYNNSAASFAVDSSALVNNSGDAYIAYLFASCPGVSKVGSYTGNGTSQTIDCGFTTGARFVLVKRTNATGNWMVMDTKRGIVAGNDPVLFLESTSAEQTGDWIDPANTGFIINDVGTGFNENGSTYIFYAIA